MYENHYGLKSKPFCLVPDPHFLFPSTTFKRGIAYLHYGIERGEGVIVISGEAGTGKTFLIRSLLDDITDDDVIVRMLIMPSLDADELVRAVLTCFGIKPARNKAEQLDCLKRYLLARARENKRVILAVDEAHCLSQSALEELRMLSNFQLDERALLQIFLLGQPALWETLGSSNMVQFKQRIIAAHHMELLSPDETRQYVLSRLRKADWNGNPTFNPDVFALIHEHSEGNPRKINRLCDRVLLQGFLEGSAVVDRPLVSRAIDELSEELMEKQREVAGSHARRPIKTQPFNQPPKQALWASFDLVSTQTTQKQAVDEGDKNSGLHTNNRRRTLVGLSCAGLLCVGVFYLLQDNDYSSLSLEVAQRSQTAPLQSTLSIVPEVERPGYLLNPAARLNTASQPTMRRSYEMTSETSSNVQPQSVENDFAEISISSPVSAKPQHREILQSRIVEAIPPVSDQKNIALADTETPVVDAVPVDETVIAAVPLVSIAPLLTQRSTGNEATSAAVEKPAKKPLAAQPALKKPVLIRPASEMIASGNTPSLLVKKPSKIVPGTQFSPGTAEEVPSTRSDIDGAIMKQEIENDKQAFSHLISRFSSAYEMGDVEELKGIFSQDVSTPESNDRTAIIDSYKKLFSFTEARQVIFRDVQWAQEGDHYIGLGRFEAAIREKGRRRQRSYHGEVEFHLENRDEKPIITYVAHTYD